MKTPHSVSISRSASSAEGRVEFYLGGCGDFDFVASRACQEFRPATGKGRLLCISPYPSKAHGAPYDETVYPELEHVPYRYAIAHRNKRMVEDDDLIFCCADHSFGGAFSAFSYAQTLGKPICNLGTLSPLVKNDIRHTIPCAFFRHDRRAKFARILLT
jgi:hypothetical protein